jgi:hypothetical protein
MSKPTKIPKRHRVRKIRAIPIRIGNNSSIWEILGDNLKRGSKKDLKEALSKILKFLEKQFKEEDVELFSYEEERKFNWALAVIKRNLNSKGKLELEDLDEVTSSLAAFSREYRRKYQLFTGLAQVASELME